MTIKPVLATVTRGFNPADSKSGDSSVPAAIPNAPAPIPAYVWRRSELSPPGSAHACLHSAP
jgi:hypothetical protein